MTVVTLPDYHTIIAVNKEFETITGYLREQTVGKKAGFFKSKLISQSTYESMKNS
jgi:PAS domain S-box-containing protein